MRDPTDWAWTPQAVAAIATSIAAFLALFGERLRAALLKPKLVAVVLDAKGYSTKYKTTKNDVSVENVNRWYHLKVTNEAFGGWPRATEVQLWIIRVERRLGDDYSGVWESRLPLKLRYAPKYSTRTTVGPALEVDLFNIAAPPGIQPELHLCTTDRPQHLETAFTGETHLRLTVLIEAIETDPVISQFTVDWDGKWVDGNDEMARHVKFVPFVAAAPR